MLDRRPERRALRIFAFDPMLGRAGDHRITIEIPYRDVRASPGGFFDDRLSVVDYDAAAKRLYLAVNLDDPHIAMQQGLPPAEFDPHFHQQMVYAVASRVLESFDRALGRRLRFWGGQRLRLLPHAFQGRNAYYDHQLNAVLFGYFAADRDDPGANLPGQFVFTCLSQDVCAHEVAHAALDRLHRYYREPTNPHVPALHEAFADIVALFQRFTFTGVVRTVMQQTRGDLAKPNPLLDIGAQFGAAAGLGAPLRTAGGSADPMAFSRTREPHALGRLLLAAVYEGFTRTYERRTADLVRIATGGSGRLPEGELHPDLVDRLSTECIQTAQLVLAMCIRATDYLPPVDPTFSDYLRAMVTADYELNRADAWGLRAAMVEAFRARGIRPEAVGSLAVESLLLSAEDPASPTDSELADIVRDLLSVGARDLSRNTISSPDTSDTPTRRRPVKKLGQMRWVDEVRADLASLQGNEDEPDMTWAGIGQRLNAWCKGQRQRLGLDAELPIDLAGFHPVHRVAPGGDLVVEMVAKLVQTDRQQSSTEDWGGLSYRAGVTLIATSEGRIRYLIRKKFDETRRQAIRDWVAAFDDEMGMKWAPRRPPNRILEAFSARAMDARRWHR